MKTKFLVSAIALIAGLFLFNSVQAQGNMVITNFSPFTYNVIGTGANDDCTLPWVSAIYIAPGGGTATTMFPTATTGAWKAWKAWDNCGGNGVGLGPCSGAPTSATFSDCNFYNPTLIWATENIGFIF